MKWTIALFLLISFRSSAQDWQVLLPAIIGNFAGDCLYSQAALLKQKENDRPYTIHEKSITLSVDVRKQKSNSVKDVVINVESVSAGAGTSPPQNYIPKITITDLQVTRGSIYERVDENNFERSTQVRLRLAEFPLRVRIVMELDFLDIEIFEAGYWQIDAKIKR
jgi:hypothetical protein